MFEFIKETWNYLSTTDKWRGSVKTAAYILTPWVAFTGDNPQSAAEEFGMCAYFTGDNVFKRQNTIATLKPAEIQKMKDSGDRTILLCTEGIAYTVVRQI